jgi:hypothetical protein
MLSSPSFSSGPWQRASSDKLDPAEPEETKDSNSEPALSTRPSSSQPSKSPHGFPWPTLRAHPDKNDAEASFSSTHPSTTIHELESERNQVLTKRYPTLPLPLLLSRLTQSPVACSTPIDPAWRSYSNAA